MRILVTGGSGFIGSHFIKRALSIKNNQVMNIDKNSYAVIKNSLDTVKNNKFFFNKKFDILDVKKLNKTIFNFKPDWIVNFAAETHVDNSINNHKEFIYTNFLGTYNLLNTSLSFYNSVSSQNKNKFKFLQISTDEVYGHLGPKEKSFTEKNQYIPSSPYSASKAAADHLVYAWYKTYNMPTIISNCSNNFGPFQNIEKLVPKTIFNCLNNLEIPIYGKGNQIRDWLYVEDHVEALFFLLKNGKLGNNYNIGSNNEIRNIDIVKTIIKKISKMNINNLNLNLIKFVQDRKGHDFRYSIDYSKIKKLGWEPKYNFIDSLELTINWYIKNIKWLKKKIK